MTPLLCCALLLCRSGARGEDTGRGPDSVLVKAIDDALAIPSLQTGWQGVVIQSLTDATVLYERNADHTFLPASNNKLLTSATAIAMLGADYTYHTRLYRTGSLSANGTLQGDLILRGAGDPLLSPPELYTLTQKVRLAGIRRIAGSVRYDDSLFDRQRLGEGWEWDDEPFYYSAQISALNLNENMVYIQATPGRKAGARVRLAVGPIASYATVLNTAVTGPAKSKSTLRFDRMRGRNIILVRGSLPLDAAAKDNKPFGVTIEEPSRFAATVLAEYLQRAGIRSTGGVHDSPSVPQTAVLVAEHVSPPLSVLLKRLNKPSDNLVAECLLKTVGAMQKGRGTGGADGTGAQTARDWLRSISLDMDRLHQADGSGLSRANFVSPRNLVRLLTYLHTRPDFATFYDSLPIAGVDGTLRRRLKGTAAENNCRAKTGYVSHVSSLSGYVTTHDGEMLVFSILMNNHLAPNSVCLAAQDKIVRLLADYTRTPTKQQTAARP